jgi:hypothetical protein
MKNLRYHLRLLVTAAGLIMVSFAKADELTPEEQVLVSKGAVQILHDFLLRKKRNPIFSRSLLRSAEFLLQNSAILRNAVRIRYR